MRTSHVVSSGTGFILLAACLLGAGSQATAPLQLPPIVIRMVESPDGSQVAFDPVGVHVQPGQVVRWVQMANFHSVSAYHPANGRHECRIPTDATPWDSGVLTGLPGTAGASFERTFRQEGVYDYFCQPHEQSGMVGRIVVGRPLAGPGTRPCNYAPEKGWEVVPESARQSLPAVSEILRLGQIPCVWR